MATSSARPPRRRSNLVDEHPAWPAPLPDPAPEPASVPTEERALGSRAVESSPVGGQASGAPMPPPRRRKTIRVQLNTRVRQDLHQRLTEFVEQHDAAVQDVIEGALEEYLERRASS